MSGKHKFYTLVGILGCLLLGLCSQEGSFDHLRDMRIIARIPESKVNWVIEGEVQLNGQAKSTGTRLKSPKTKTNCLYYRYHVEREEKDSEGDTTWVTVKDERKAVDFLLRDADHGHILLRAKLGRPRIDFTVYRDFRIRSGKMRYTEYRIEEGTPLFIFGYAKPVGKGSFQVDFRTDGLYLPIISEGGSAVEERRSKAFQSVLFCFCSVLLISMSAVFVCFLGGIHRVLAFLVLVSAGLGASLVWYAMNMMHNDLVASRDRALLHEERAVQVFTEMTGGDRRDFLHDPQAFNASLRHRSPKEADRLHGIRQSLASSIRRTNEIRNRFPEKLLAPLWGVRRLEELEPLQDPPVQAGGTEEIPRVPLNPFTLIMTIVVAFVLGLFGLRSGFRKIKTKRYIENIPTSPTAGLAYGPGELTGTVEIPQGQPPLSTPIEGSPAVYYHYVVKERRGSGKKAKWVTITNRKQSMDFLCRDAEGTITINPEDAEIYTKHSRSKSRGRRLYIETWLEVGDPLYALGTAALDTEQMDHLVLQKSKDFPLLLANLPERQVLLRKSRAAILTTNLGFNGLILLVLAIFASIGSYAATDYLFAALVAPAFCVFMMVALMFNDLVFLRERVKRAWANIQVSLKKRADLVPTLLEVVQAYGLHEKEIQETLAQLRTDSSHTDRMDHAQAGEFMAREAAVVNHLLAVREGYPDLKANTLTEDLMRRIVGLENEVALMRNGYNDSVERHNTKIRHIPEVLLAKAFNFKPAEFFHAEIEIRDFKGIDFEIDDGPHIHEEVETDEEPEEPEKGEDGEEREEVDQ